MVRRYWKPARVLIVLALALLGALSWAAGGATGGTVDRQLIVGLRDGATEASLMDALAAAGAHVTGHVASLNLLTVAPAPGSGRRLAAGLQHHPAVRYAYPDEALFSLLDTPNDPLYVAGRQWNIDRVQAPRAWDLLPPGATTTVAVLDTGIDYTHPDLAGRISPAACDAFRHTCGTGLAQIHLPDVFGHGTHVAGIIGAATNNSTGIASVSGGRAVLLPIQVLSPGGGLVEEIQESILVTAITYAVDQGAKVINMSFGGPCGTEPRPATRDVMAYAEAHDVLFVFAAGNSGGCRDGRFPQNDPRVLSVAATDLSDNAATFTDVGLTVAVAAPGVGIVSTVPRSCNTGICDPSGYNALRGTSMAAPHVAAEAALLFQVPGATKAKVVDWITRTCDSAAVSVQCGGRINVYRAAHLAVKGYDPLTGPPAPADTAAPASPDTAAPAPAEPAP